MSADRSDGAGGASSASARGGFDSASKDTTEGKENAFQFRADTDLGGVATRSEKEFLEANRPKPEVELHLTPEGFTEASVKQKVNLDQERRIQQIGNSLTLARDRLKNGFSKSQDRGYEREK